MGRFLFLLLIGIAIYLLLAKRSRGVKSRGGADRKPGFPAPETMVSCAYCRLNIPLSDSVAAGGRHYCGEEHRRLDAGKQGD